VEADLRNPALILKQAARTLDFAQPAAVLLVAVLQFIPDSEDPAGIVEPTPAFADAEPRADCGVVGGPRILSCLNASC
jgi:hypothetical protein